MIGELWSIKIDIIRMLIVVLIAEYKVAIEGKVIQRAECRPVNDANYMALKRSAGTFESLFGVAILLKTLSLRHSEKNKAL